MTAKCIFNLKLVNIYSGTLLIRTPTEHAKASLLSGLSQKNVTDRPTNFFSIQRLKQTFLRQQNVVSFLNCNRSLIYHSLGPKSPISISLRAEVDADSGMQRTSKRKKSTKNDCSKRPRKWNFCVGLVGEDYNTKAEHQKKDRLIKHVTLFCYCFF